MGSYVPVRKLRVVGPTPLAGPSGPNPPAGSVGVGELLIDSQSRMMWLGVDSSIDPLQSILLSDILALQQTDAENLANARAYAESLFAQAAPLDHEHDHTDINDWDAAIAASIAASNLNWQYGMIMPFFGNPNWIGNRTTYVRPSAIGGESVVIDLRGWHLCDGGNGTPNLQDKFIIGAGSAIKPWNGYLTSGAAATEGFNVPDGTYITNNSGGHSHGGTSEGARGSTYMTSLTIGQMPYHEHAVQDRYSNIRGSGHAHAIINFGRKSSISYTSGATVKQIWEAGTGAISEGSDDNITASEAYVRPEKSSGWLDIVSTGNNEGHFHEIPWQGQHAHALQADTYKALPWFAFAYMMKVLDP
jgi:hypothetical protein